MRNLFPNLAYLLPLSSYLLPALRATAAVVSTPPTVIDNSALNASSLPALLGNNSLVGAIDPTKFQIGSRYLETKLPATPVLMTAVDIMVRLSLQDWDSRFSKRAFFMDLPRFSQVEIFFSPPDPRGELKIAFAILGLFEVMNSVLTDPTQRFKESTHSLFYNNRDVGFIEIRKKGRRPDPSLELDDEKSSSKRETNATTALAAPAWEDPHLEVNIIRGHETLTIYEVFYAVYALLRTTALETAKLPPNTPMRAITFGVDAPPITTRNHPISASFKSYDHPPRTASNPPYFQPKWLLKALGRLPLTMMETRDFKEIYDMTMQVDGVKVGTGYIVRKQTAVGGVDSA